VKAGGRLEGEAAHAMNLKGQWTVCRTKGSEPVPRCQVKASVEGVKTWKRSCQKCLSVSKNNYLTRLRVIFLVRSSHNSPDFHQPDISRFLNICDFFFAEVIFAWTKEWLRWLLPT